MLNLMTDGYDRLQLCCFPEIAPGRRRNRAFNYANESPYAVRY